MRKNRKPQRLSNLAMGMVQFLVLAGPVTAQIPCGYEVQIIQGPWCGEIYGYPPTVAKGISDAGTVVGYYTSCLIGPSEAFIWTEDTGLITLERPQGYTDAGAEDIDSATGWIVGALQTPDTDGPFAAVWADGKVFDLGTMPGGDFSNARAIESNPNPIIVGKWGNENVGPIHGFIWEDGVMTDLGPDLGTPSSRANDIRAGRVVGWMGDAFLQDGQAYIWHIGNVIPLPNPPNMFSGRGHAITSRGEVVVGAAQLDDGSNFGLTRAMLWENGRPILLDIPQNSEQSTASAVADNGMVVGAVGGPGPVSAGFIWYERLTLDVNTLVDPETGVEVTGCRAINSQGQIAAVGHDAKGDVIALLLTPVEPPLGDIDMDCAVGVKDLLILLGRWGPCGDCDDCSADLDGNCIVGVNDLLLLLGNWG